MCVLKVGPNSICGRGGLGRQLAASRSTISGLCCGGNCVFFKTSPMRISIRGSSVSLRMHVRRNPRTAVGQIVVGNGSHLCRSVIHHRLHAGPNVLFDHSSLVHSAHRVTRVKRFSPRGLIPRPVPSPSGKAISVRCGLISGTGSRVRFSTN